MIMFHSVSGLCEVIKWWFFYGTVRMESELLLEMLVRVLWIVGRDGFCC